MPPILATILGLTFVAFLLRREEANTRELSRAIWLPTLWFLLSVSRSLTYWFSAFGAGALSTSYMEGNPLDRNVRIVLIIIGILILRQRRTRLSEVLAVNRILILIFAYMALSILWSDYPLISLKRWVRALGFLIMGLIVATEDTPWKAIDAIARRLVYIAVPISLLLIKYYPQMGINFHRWQGFPMWVGITISKNDFGVLACYGSLFMLRHLTARQKSSRGRVDKDFLLHSTLLLACLGMLKGSGSAYSATSILVFAGGLVFHAGLTRYRANPAIFLRYAALAGAFILLLLVFTPDVLISSTTQTLGRKENLTGRTEIWRAMTDEAMKRPILGTGYGAFYLGETTYDWSDISGAPIGEGHNGFLDVFLELGIVGVILYLMLILTSLRVIASSLKHDPADGRLRLTLMVMLLIHNMAESGFFSGLPSLWFLWVLAVMNRARPVAAPDQAAVCATADVINTRPHPRGIRYA